MLKNSIYTLSEFFLIVFLKMFRFLFKSNHIKKIAILGPAPEGSLGDEALIVSFICQVRSRLKDAEISLFCQSFEDRWESLRGVKKNYCLINFISYDSILSRVKFLISMYLYDHFICIGADVLDGFYGDSPSLGFYKVAELARKINLKVGIINFSFNNNPTERVKQALINMHKDIYFIARDKQSQANMHSLLGREVLLGCDLAFLLEPAKSEKNKRIISWMAERKAAGCVILGVNINMLPFKNTFLSDDVEKIIGIYSSVINKVLLKNENIALVLIPHDYRFCGGGPKMCKLECYKTCKMDLKLCALLDKKIGNEYSQRKIFVDCHLSAAEIKEICRNLDFCITGRFHLGIACLSQYIPVIALNYQEKLEGIFRDLDISELLVQPNDFLEAEKFTAYFYKCFDKRNNFSERLRRNVPVLKALADINLKNIN